MSILKTRALKKSVSYLSFLISFQLLNDFYLPPFPLLDLSHFDPPHTKIKINNLSWTHPTHSFLDKLPKQITN